MTADATLEIEPESDVSDLLKVEPMLDRLRRAIPECREELELIEGRLSDVRFRPGEECAAHYKLVFRRRADGAQFKHPVTVHLPVAGPPDAPTEALIQRYLAIEPRTLRDPVITMPEIGAVVYPHPIDIRLPGLIEALDKRVAKFWLGRILRRRDLTVLHVKPRLISYTVGARATIRYRLRVLDAAGVERIETVIGKLNAQKALAPLMAANHALYRETEGLFGQAEPLGMVQSIGLSLQSFAPGERLSDRLGDANAADHLRAVGDALARVHGARIPHTAIRDPKKEIRSLDRRGRLLAAVHPDPARIKDLSARLAAALEERAHVNGLVHGDFHHANVMVAEGGVSLIDFDEMGLGDQSLDVGRFMVSLSVPSLRLHGDLRLCDLARETFLPAYEAVRPVDHAKVRLFEAAAWITSAVTAFRLQRENWRENLLRLSENAETALAEALSTPAPAHHSGPADFTDAERRRWAEDVEFVSLLLKPGVHDRYGAEIVETRLEQAKQTGAGLALRYRVSGRSKDGRWHGRVRGLCDAGLNPRRIIRGLKAVAARRADAPEALAVPVPIGRSQALGLLFHEIAPGDPLADCLTTGDAAARAGRALAALHGLDVTPPRIRSAEAILQDWREAAADLAEFDRIAATLDRDAPIRASIEAPRLSDIVVGAEGVALIRPEKLVAAPPLFAAAALISEAAAVSAEAAGAMRAAYVAAAPELAEALGPYEALLALARGARDGA